MADITQAFTGILDTMLGSLWIVVAIFVGILLVGTITLVVYQIKRGKLFAKFPVKVRIWERRAGGLILGGVDKGRAINEEGAWFYELQKKKIMAQPFDFNYINPDNSLDVLALSRDEFHPFSLITEKATVIKSNGVEEEIDIPRLKPVIDENIKHIYIHRQHKNMRRKPLNDFLIKYAPILAPILAGIMCILVIIVFMDRALPMAEALQAAAKTNTACRIAMEAVATGGAAP